MELLSGQNWILPKENTLACFNLIRSSKNLDFCFCRKEIVQKVGTFGFSHKGTCPNPDLHQTSLHNGSPNFNDVPKMFQIGLSDRG